MKRQLVGSMVVLALAAVGAKGAEFEPFLNAKEAPVLDAKLKEKVKEGMTLEALVGVLGKGWMPMNSSAGIMEWHFSDGVVLMVWPWDFEAKEKLKRGAQNHDGARYWWEDKDGNRIEEVAATRAGK